jgi:Ca-activated chloride channel family protein
MGAFSAGEHKTALIRLRVPRGAAGERPVAAVRLRYDDLVDQKPGLCEGTLAAIATADTTKLSPLDGAVSARVSASETAATLESANEMFRTGRSRDASNLLRERSQRVRSVGWKVKQDSPFAGGDVGGTGRAAATASFDKQAEVLDRAAKGFEAESPAAAPPSPTSTPAKANARNAQADAFTLSH